MSVVAALALVAGSAQAQEAGWDTKYGILFTLPNPFGGGSGANVLSDYNGLVGFQMNLGPQTGLRLSADLSRFSEGVDEVKTPTATYKYLPAVTSAYGVTLAAEYMMRMSTAAIAPYAGIGAFVGFTQSSRNGKNEVPGTVTDYDNFDRTYDVGAIGKLGLEWRIHKVISLFAEYQADLTLASGTSSQTNVKINGVVNSDTTSKEAHFLNLSTGLSNGGRLGVVAFF
jgi:hypothetical protein